MADKNNKLFKITKPFLMMVEGKDDREMLYRLCDHIGLSREQVQIFEYRGKEKFPAALKFITNSEKFETVEKLGVFRDADDGSESAFQSIEYHLKASDLIPDSAIPSSQGTVSHSDDEQASMSIGVFIMPNCSDHGALESLLLGSLSNEMHSEIAGFIANSEALLGSDRTRDKFKNSDKSKVYAYSALFENANFHDMFNKRLWEFDHATFDKLKAFLREFG